MEIHAKLGNTVLMITHDVDEAVLLSDRIVMMTNGPAARIGEVLEVPMARPRKRLELVADSTYIRCRQRVIEFLYARHRAPALQAAEEGMASLLDRQAVSVAGVSPGLPRRPFTPWGEGARRADEGAFTHAQEQLPLTSSAE